MGRSVDGVLNVASRHVGFGFSADWRCLSTTSWGLEPTGPTWCVGGRSQEIKQQGEFVLLMWHHPQRMMVTLKSRLDCGNNFTLLLSFAHCVPRLDAFAGDALAECAVLTTCWWMHECAW